MNLNYYALRITAAVMRFLPIRFGYFIAELGGNALYLLSKRRRNITSNNIKHVLGTNVDKRRLQPAVRSIFKNMVKNYFDLIKLPQLELDNLGKSVTFNGWHYLEKALSSERGTIIATAHLGNFDFAAQVLAARGIKMAIFVEDFNSTPVLGFIDKLRQINGVTTLPVSSSTLRDALQILRQGGTLVIVCDRNIQGNGLKVKFFGEETSLPFGVVSLALRTGAAIVPMFSVRKSGNRFVIYTEAPLRLANTGSRSQAVRANLERLIAIMERYIRQYPEQWVVLEPIWPEQAVELADTQRID